MLNNTILRGGITLLFLFTVIFGLGLAFLLFIHGFFTKAKPNGDYQDRAAHIKPTKVKHRSFNPSSIIKLFNMGELTLENAEWYADQGYAVICCDGQVEDIIKEN